MIVYNRCYHARDPPSLITKINLFPGNFIRYSPLHGIFETVKTSSAAYNNVRVCNLSQSAVCRHNFVTIKAYHWRPLLSRARQTIANADRTAVFATRNLTIQRRFAFVSSLHLVIEYRRFFVDIAL